MKAKQWETSSGLRIDRPMAGSVDDGPHRAGSMRLAERSRHELSMALASSAQPRELPGAQVAWLTAPGDGRSGAGRVRRAVARSASSARLGIQQRRTVGAERDHQAAAGQRVQSPRRRLEDHDSQPEGSRALTSSRSSVVGHGSLPGSAGREQCGARRRKSRRARRRPLRAAASAKQLARASGVRRARGARGRRLGWQQHPALSRSPRACAFLHRFVGLGVGLGGHVSHLAHAAERLLDGFLCVLGLAGRRVGQRLSVLLMSCAWLLRFADGILKHLGLALHQSFEAFLRTLIGCHQRLNVLAPRRHEGVHVNARECGAS